MINKKLLIIISSVAVLALPFSVFAATSDSNTAKKIRGFFGIDTSKLTDKQKSDVTEYSKKMADLQKQFIDKMVENGSMTKEQGDAAKSKIDEAQKNGSVAGLMPGPKMGMGKDGFGKRGGFGLGAVDTSKLTDQQKADLLATYNKIADLEKTYIDKMVTDSLISKDQATTAKSKVDEMINNIKASNYSKGMDLFMGGLGVFKCFGMKNIDTSKITDQVKTDLKDFSTKMAALQKELINKMVTNGSITKDQGDKASTMIDNMLAKEQANGFTSDFGMRKGGKFGRFGGKGNFSKNNTSTPTPSATTKTSATTL